MREEYDFSDGVQGKYSKHYSHGTNVVLLDPEIRKFFQSDDAANTALREYLEIKKKLASRGV